MKSIQFQLQDLLTKSGIPAVIEPTSIPSYGDYTTNAALIAAKSSSAPNARELAEQIKQKIEGKKPSFIETIEVAGPGFINFKLKTEYLHEHFSLPQFKKINKKTIIEYMQPNTNKPLHIGHLRNATLGKSLINLKKEVGWEVKAATVNNDRGLHITKSMWAYLIKAQKDQTPNSWKEKIISWDKNPSGWMKPKDMEEQRLHKGDFFVGHWYVLADQYAQDERVQKEWQEMLLAWENKNDPLHQSIRSLWKQMNSWFYEGAKQSYALLDVEFDPDQVSFESDVFEAGKQIVLSAAKKGIFEQLSDGAIRANLEEKFKLPNKILLRRDGTGIYMTFDIELTRQRTQQKADLLVWVVGNDQDLYFKQLFAVCELLGYGHQENFRHFSYGMVRLPQGKMSSRKGTVIYADDVLQEAIAKAREIMENAGVGKGLAENEKVKVAQQVGIGAVKFTMLSYDPQSEIAFDTEKSVTFEGNSGPYLQYAHARCQSILSKVGEKKPQIEEGWKDSESALVHKLERYPLMVERAAKEFAPHYICTYLMELASSFGRFYDQCPVLGSRRREEITRHVALTLAHGLNILGIAAPERM